ncbi:NUDIX domain-containing protein [bacterium]|nr:NUDIX domain-containing protein [candidate division CSSED10-310 bacterium]
MQAKESLFCVDNLGMPTTPLPREMCHGNPCHTHKVVHVLVLNEQNNILLQKRSRYKDIQPGRWDTSVGGHLIPGESEKAGALRECKEELGFVPENLMFLHQYMWLTDVESEIVSTYISTWNGPFDFDENEIEEIAFFSNDQIGQLIEKDKVTPNFRYEFECFTCRGMSRTMSNSHYPIRDICLCNECNRLVHYRSSIIPKSRFSEKKYWNLPVPGFGDALASLLIAGLAPGAHGANRTGRPFTGDAAGILLYENLNKLGLCNRAEAICRGDGMELKEVFVTNAVKCAPPKNLPNASEINRCRRFLEQEFQYLTRVKVIVALGRIAFQSVMKALRVEGSSHSETPLFQHGKVYDTESSLPCVIASYHPSMRNINTGLLSKEAFFLLLKSAVKLSRDLSSKCGTRS